MLVQNPDLIQNIDTFYTNKYLSEVSSSNETICKPLNGPFDYGQLSLYQITSIAFDKNSDILNKLATVYSTVYNSKSSPILLLNSTDGKEVKFYLGIKGENDIFEKSFKSHFGVKLSGPLKDNEINEIIKECVQDEKIDQITAFTGLPSLKNNDHNLFSQGLDSFMEAMRGEKFTAMFIADFIESDVIKISRNNIDNAYTVVSQYETIRKTYGTSSSNQISETKTNGESQSNFYKNIKNIFADGAPAALATAKAAAKKPENIILATVVGGAATLGGPVAAIGGVGITVGALGSTNETISKTEGETEGKSYSQDVTYTHKRIKNLLEKLDKQSKRFTDAEWAGMFHFGCYFLSANEETVKLAASAYKALVQGNDSHVDESYLFHWGRGTNIRSETVKNSLAQFQHPKFQQGNFPEVATATFVHSNEMALLFGLPRKSVNGVIVKQSVEFGRNIPKQNADISIGSIIHLGEPQGIDVSLDLQSLSMHTLITGSTGSGKSTTTYTLIEELKKHKDKDIKFLVIEPTKGEYKHIFGNDPAVNVYGTNCKFTPLLRINPFSFPTEQIHVLEHIDRLVEIFNACWPMYAAMPAILKDAILHSYENCGWDMDNSISDTPDHFPSFYDVLDNLETLLESSMYSDNTKADYKGALITRIKSLTQGLIKNIFTADALTDKDLFENNVIVDLSRVGSSETKSLIMGILMLKLNEYRISSDKMNKKLQHVAILEEAHHILPRVSTQNSQESSNIKGKAVEMLSNAIAEMRTYGQGFVIVDQSPNMLDISAIRNTNTKIIMRLSELEDRNDIGKSAALNDEQINEIPKLSQGVAIVYQNGWEEAVLCKVKDDVIKRDDEDSPKDPFKNNEPCEAKRMNISKIIKYLVIKDTHILESEQRELIEEFEKDEELKKYLAINSLKDKVRVVQDLIDAREIKNTKHVTFNMISEKIRKKILLTDKEYEKLLVNYILVDLSRKAVNITLKKIQEMIEDKDIEDFITLHKNKKNNKAVNQEKVM